jgi:Zinc knuckle
MSAWKKKARERQTVYKELRNVTVKKPFPAQQLAQYLGLRNYQPTQRPAYGPKPNQGRAPQTTSQVVPMDVDTGNTGRRFGPGQWSPERQDLYQKGACFICKAQGHISRDCPQKSKKNVPRATELRPRRRSHRTKGDHQQRQSPETDRRTRGRPQNAPERTRRGKNPRDQCAAGFLPSPKLAAVVRALKIRTMYINKQNSIKLPFSLYTYRGKAEETTLIDSGATENFVDYKTVARLRLGTKKLDQVRPIINIDGTSNQAGDITHYCDLLVTRGQQTRRERFFVTNLGKD